MSDFKIISTSKSAGHGIRYDADLGGNHIQRIRDEADRRYSGTKYVLNSKSAICWTCNRRKERKGGKYVVGKFMCASCRSRSEA